ncbi:hypothetical protein BJX64DRAFT_279647 [Aspergillus heterothallicus]
MILAILSFLARLGALSASLIVVGLNAKFITERLWLTDLLVYIEVAAAASVLGALVPPYPNFLYDSFWAALWIVAAVFALVVQFAESNCYGLQPHSPIECATYKAATAFAFIALFSWLGSAFLVGPPHLPVIYAAPAFARYLIEGIPVPDNVRIQLKNPTNDSIGVTLASDVWVPDGGEVTFYPMDVTFFSNDEYPNFDPIASVSLPKLKYKATEHINLPEQRLQLENLDAFARFIKHAAFNSTFTLGSVARAKVKFMSIGTEVDLYKTVTFPAFNAFPTIEFKEIGLKTKDENGYNLHAKVVLDNPTPASATLTYIKGDVTLNAMIGDFIIGEGRVSVANIIPGKNTFDVDAKLNVTNLRDNINAIMAIELPYLRKEQILASASVTAVVYEGEHLPYWEEAFGRLEIALARPIRPLVQSVLDSGFLGSYVGPIVDRVLNIILENVQEMDADDLEDYASRLGDIGTRALGLLSTLGML